MSRDRNKILQIPSPTDGSLKRFITTLFEETTVSSVTLKIGIFSPKTIGGIIEVDPEAKEENAAESRSFDEVKRVLSNGVQLGKNNGDY